MKNIFLGTLIVVSFVLVLVFPSCDSPAIFKQNLKIENNIWVRDQIADFDVEIKDTTMRYDVNVEVRHASHYPFANLLIELNIIYPSGEERVKAHDLLLRNSDGKFKGNGLGDIWDISIPIYKNHAFNTAGKYKFSIRNIMPVHETPGLMEIGLNIKKSK
jgi:gliding motility-associated lipoprotein GldH